MLPLKPLVNKVIAINPTAPLAGALIDLGLSPIIRYNTDPSTRWSP